MNKIDEMLEAKRRYKNLRCSYLEKIEKIKKEYKYDFEHRRRHTIFKKEIILGLVFDLHMGWNKFGISNHYSELHEFTFFHKEGFFNPARVFHLKWDAEKLCKILSESDWISEVENRHTVMGFNDWKKSMSGEEIQKVISILSKREGYVTGVYSIPELFGKQEFFVLAKKDRNRCQGYNL